MKFNVGDRVQKVYGAFAGEFGKVVGYDSKIKACLVEFDKSNPYNKHDGNGMCKQYHGYWCEPTNLRLIEAVDDTKIEIFRSGKTVIALKRTNGKVVAKGVAKCHPDDEFDFDIGARLAMERCVGKADTAIPEKHVGNTSGDDWWYTSTNYVRKVSAEPTHKFKVGDLVIGNKLATDRYAITQEGWIGRVTKVSDKHFCAMPNNQVWMTKGFFLEYDYFDKYTVDKK